MTTNRTPEEIEAGIDGVGGVEGAAAIVKRDVDRLQSIPERTNHAAWMLEDLESLLGKIRALLPVTKPEEE